MERKTIEENKNGVRDYAVLVGLRSPVLGADSADEESLAELAALVETAGGESVGMILQSREKPDPHSFIGEGKVEEVKRMVENSEATMVIFDNDLSPSQVRVLTELCGVQVLDRSGLILDIFAQRARTKEGCLQVELAQYQYLLPRLIGMWSHLERQGGTGGSPIGTKGPGETQLETDRRLINKKIDKIRADLEEVRRVRATQRQQRQKNEIPVVAIVGYTNVGKSTLLNTLTQAGVLAEDKLFATLDPTARALELPDGRKVMLIDTVGLVRRLPHQLVEAFHSTLEEAASADLILSVCDITSPELLEQRAVTERLLEELGMEGTPVITVLNKCDAAPDAQNEPYKGCVRISAKTGYGLPRLLQTIAETLPPQRIRCRLCLPYAEGALLHRLEEQGQIFSREYTAEGTLLDAEVEQRDWRLYETYLRTED